MLQIVGCSMGRRGQKKSGLILVVDDDPVYTAFWQRMFRDMNVTGYVITHDPKEAKKILREKHVGFLISDIVMPSINGYELARYALRKNHDTMIVLTTAYGARLDHFELSHPHFHLLHKPYMNLSDLRKFLEHILGGDSSFDDMSEDSFSENDDYPEVMEWSL